MATKIKTAQSAIRAANAGMVASRPVTALPVTPPPQSSPAPVRPTATRAQATLKQIDQQRAAQGMLGAMPPRPVEMERPTPMPGTSIPGQANADAARAAAETAMKARQAAAPLEGAEMASKLQQGLVGQQMPQMPPQQSPVMPDPAKEQALAAELAARGAQGPTPMPGPTVQQPGLSLAGAQENQANLQAPQQAAFSQQQAAELAAQKAAQAQVQLQAAPQTPAPQSAPTLAQLDQQRMEQGMLGSMPPPAEQQRLASVAREQQAVQAAQPRRPDASTVQAQIQQSPEYAQARQLQQALAKSAPAREMAALSQSLQGRRPTPQQQERMQWLQKQIQGSPEFRAVQRASLQLQQMERRMSRGMGQALPEANRD